MTQEQATLEDQAIERLVHLHSGRATAADRQAFAHWSQLSDAHRAAAQGAQSLWDDLPQTEAARHFVPPAPRRTRRRLLTVALAASLAIVVVGGALLDPLVTLRADHVTTVGERRQLHLQDGSQLWLNSASAVAIDYSPGSRTVRLLKGEALFDVAKDATRPFIVQAGDGSVRAVGTRFDVDLHARHTDVVVSEGIVEVTSGKQTAVRLVAGQGVTYQAGQPLGALRQVDAQDSTAWQRGKLIFNRRPLGEVLAELERHLPGKLHLTDDALRGLRISGVFELDDPQAALRTLEQTQPLSITRLPLLTLIRPKP
ncbi:FecR family protein [Pseudomonas sp. ABC1]|nr:FecR family protein [Pseudomonas sp. ABC1]